MPCSHRPTPHARTPPPVVRLAATKVRVKKHRWHRKILKTRDPLVISVGWRRFQTVPVYGMRDPSRRCRFLKYTPEHMHCLATFWGPITPPNTGMLAFSSTSKASFRIAATGVVLEADQSMTIVKKLKLTGTPYKIFKNTAFVKDMFSSNLEVRARRGDGGRLWQRAMRVAAQN